MVNNNDLITLSGLRNLRFIEGHFSVSKNASLTSLSGLEKLISVKGDFVVINNEDLSTLNGLKNLNTIGGSFYVSNNTSLTSLNGLENLISIDNSLKVWKNPSLTSLNGLENLTSIGGYMDAYDNASLENQNGLKHVSVRGQIIDVKTKGLYKIWVMPMDKSPKLKGYLTGLEDSLITVSKHLNKLELTRNNQSINIQNIETIKFRRKGRIGRGILVGALTGFTIGGILGLSSEDDRRGIVSFTKEQKALMGGVVLSVPGAIIGAIIGSLKVKIPINGNRTTFKNRKKDLRNFMITN